MQHLLLTAKYTNAVLAAVLPLVSNCIDALKLPIKQPIERASIGFQCYERAGDVGGAVILGDFVFDVERGRVHSFNDLSRGHGRKTVNW